MTVGNPLAQMQPTQRSVLFYNGSLSTDRIYTGQVLCCDPTPTDDDQQALRFVQTSYSANKGPFFVVDQAPPDGALCGANGTTVRGFLISGESIIMQVRVDQTVAAGDYGGIHAGTYNWRKGHLLGPLCCRFLDSVTVSSGTALVLAEVGLNINFDPVGKAAVQADLFDDFFGYSATATGWTVVKDASTGVDGVTAGSLTGVMNLYCDDTDEDEVYLASNMYFKITNPFYFKARVAITEAATNDAGAIVGLTDTAGANALVDATGVPADGDHAVFYKLYDTLIWATEVQTGTTASGDSDVGASTSATYAVLEILRLVASGPIYFYYNGTLVDTRSTSSSYPAGSDARAIVGLKNTIGTANEDSMQIDYVKVENPLY